MLRFFNFSLYCETMLKNAISCEWLFNWFCPTYVRDWSHYMHHQEYIDRRVKRVTVWLFLFFRCAFENLIDRCLIISFHFLGIFHFPLIFLSLKLIFNLWLIVWWGLGTIRRICNLRQTLNIQKIQWKLLELGSWS